MNECAGAAISTFAAHLSENFGYLCLAPLIGGNLFSIMFGRNLDAHTSSADPNVPPGSGSGHTLRGLISRDLPTERQCLVGRACYVSSLRVTLMACIVALALSAWAGIRERRRNLRDLE